MGHIDGRFEQLAEALDMARGRWGQFDFVFAVGDVEHNRGYEDHLGVVGDFPRVAAGGLNLGAPLYLRSVARRVSLFRTRATRLVR